MLGKFESHWNRASIWKKSFYISFFGAFLWFLNYITYVIFVVIKNKSGFYECSMFDTSPKKLTYGLYSPCSLFDFMFKSDGFGLFIISLILIFIISFLIAVLILYLVGKTRKSNAVLSFWILIIVTLLIILLSRNLFGFYFVW